MALRHRCAVMTAVFSPNGKLVVTASEDLTAKVWDAATGTQIGNSLRHDNTLSCAAFSPDDARVVTTCSDGTARVWDATGQPIGKPLKHESSVNWAAFSPDGKRVVTASDDFTARVWDAATGEPICRPLRHADIVRRAAFSPDSARVVTASRDETARVWDATTGAPIGRPLQSLRRSPSWALPTESLRESCGHRATFNSDGTLVVTATAGKSARMWAAPPVAPNFIATACKMLGSNHGTAGLKERYGIDVKDPICTGDEPAPDPSRMVDR